MKGGRDRGQGRRARGDALNSFYCAPYFDLSKSLSLLEKQDKEVGRHDRMELTEWDRISVAAVEPSQFVIKITSQHLCLNSECSRRALNPSLQPGSIYPNSKIAHNRRGRAGGAGFQSFEAQPSLTITAGEMSSHPVITAPLGAYALVFLISSHPSKPFH